MKSSAKTIGRAVVVIAVAFVAQSAMAQDGLWRKAMETAERNTGWIPGLTTITIEELNNKGRVQSSMEMGLRTSLNEDGTLRRELVGGVMPRGVAPIGGFARGQQGGQSSASPQAGGQGGHRPVFGGALGAGPQAGGPGGDMMGFSGGQMNLFSGSLPVTVRPTERTEKVLGKLCVVYEFDLGQNEESTSGTAWLEQQTGYPVKVAMAPFQQRQTGATVMTEIYYASTEEGYWYTSTIVMNEETRRLLVLRNKTRRVMKFSEYFRTPEAAERDE